MEGIVKLRIQSCYLMIKMAILDNKFFVLLIGVFRVCFL